MPFLEIGRPDRYSSMQAIRLLRHGHKPLCTEHPTKVRGNASFVIDTRIFNNWEDVKCDLNGVYDVNIRCGVWTVNSKNGTVIQKSKKVPLCNGESYLVQNIRKSKASPLLSRAIFLLQDKNGNVLNDRCLLQYIVDNKEGQVEFEVPRHGNSKSNKPYYPSKKSVHENLKKVVTEKNTNMAYDNMRKNAGGALAAKTPSDMPRGKQQIYDARRLVQGNNDEVADMLKYARDKEDVVLHHADYPQDLWVLGTKAMCLEMTRSSTSDILSCPVYVDPTFNLGQFEVTPIVFKNVLLRSRRTGENPVFIGPTMIHHKKTYDEFSVLARATTQESKEMLNLKCFVTDGEQALQKAFQDHFPMAQSLRCFKHFNNNCRDKLRQIGIRGQKDQAYFLNATFGVEGKSEGILDAKDEDDLRKRLDSFEQDFALKEKELTKNNETKYWKYLNKNFGMMAGHMVVEVRRKGGLQDKRSYTNASESMNKIMKCKRDAFLQENPHISRMNKLQFTQHIFECIHQHQIEELCVSITGLSQEYELADFASYLQVPPDVWYEWHEKDRKEYLQNLHKLSMEDMFSCKEIPWPKYENAPEFKEIGINIAKELEQYFGYTAENANMLEAQVASLLNHPRAIQEKASLKSNGAAKYEVASDHSKNGVVDVSIHKEHVSCVCGRYRHDKLCKHSLAVAAKVSVLQTHLCFIKKTGTLGFHTPLTEGNFNKVTAGKKGGRNNNNYRCRGKKNVQCEAATSSQKDGMYTEIFHNDNNFVVMFLPKEAKSCKSCEKDFCHRLKVQPFDLVLAHKEKWYYPVEGNWANKRASSCETTKHYHIERKCVTSRFPYFNSTYVEVPPNVKDQLKDSHKTLLSKELGIEW